MVRLTDRPDMTLDVYRGRKTTIQPTINNKKKTLIAGLMTSAVSVFFLLFSFSIFSDHKSLEIENEKKKHKTTLTTEVSYMGPYGSKNEF